MPDTATDPDLKFSPGVRTMPRSSRTAVGERSVIHAELPRNPKRLSDSSADRAQLGSVQVEQVHGLPCQAKCHKAKGEVRAT